MRRQLAVDVREYTNTEIRMLVDEHIHNERDRALLKRRFCDSTKFETLAEEFDLSTQRVKAIVYAAKGRLFQD